MRCAAGFAVALWLAVSQAGAVTEETVTERADCTGLLDRMGWTAGSVATPAGACFFEDVAPEGGGWRARVLALYGDVDALPDALPTRLTGGVWGLAGDQAEDAEPDPDRAVTATFDLASGGGVLRIDRVTLRLGETWRAELSARVEAVPEVWPAEPGALNETRIVSLDGALWSETEEASGEESGWASLARPWIAALAEGNGPAAAQAEAVLDALPDARGRLDVALGEAGLRVGDLAPLLRGGLTPDEFVEIVALADLALDWIPDAP